MTSGVVTEPPDTLRNPHDTKKDLSSLPSPHADCLFHRRHSLDPNPSVLRLDLELLEIIVEDQIRKHQLQLNRGKESPRTSLASMAKG